MNRGSWLTAIWQAELPATTTILLVRFSFPEEPTRAPIAPTPPACASISPRATGVPGTNPNSVADFSVSPEPTGYPMGPTFEPILQKLLRVRSFRPRTVSKEV